MKTVSTLFYLFLYGLLTICYSQQYGWIDISDNLPDSSGTVTLSDMYWLNDNEGWICSGLKGEIYHTTDGGSTYSTQTTQYPTYAIHMLNSSEGYAGGLNGRVYRTTDGGGTWNVLGSIGGTLLSISFPPSSDTGYCCGYSGKIYRITTSGVSAMSSGVSSNLKSLSFSGSQGWTCGESVILHYNVSWLGDQSYPTETYNSVCMINNTTGWAAGDNGIIIKTTDGLNWDYQANPDTLDRTLNKVFFLNSGEGWAVGDNGIILHLTNGETAWAIEGSGLTTNMLVAVQFISPVNGFVLGNNGALFHYTEIISAVKHKDNMSINEHTFHFNYSNGLISIETSANAPLENISVLDLQGNLLKETIQKNSINVSGLSPGVYFIKFFANAKMNTVKIVKK